MLRTPVHRRRRPLLAVALALAAAAPLHAQISAAEHAARRDSLAARIGDGVVVAFGGRNPVTDFGPFRQLPAFRYLTGYLEPDAALVLVARGGRSGARLFVTPKSARAALYSGPRPDSAGIHRELGLVARPASALDAVLDSLAATGLPFYALADFEAADFARADTLTRGQVYLRDFAARHRLELRDAHPIVNQLRARKSPAELALIRRAAEITDAGHRAVMESITPGGHEYDVQAVVEHAFRRGGSERPAYGTIAGAGENGTVLHYMENGGPLRAGDVVVLDAGAEYRGYAADVTRTIPISGRFTPEQRELYAIVLEAQKAAERNSRPGMSAAAAHDSAFDVRARGLARLGLIESVDARLDLPWPADCAASPRACSQAALFTIHGISHGLGLEVHDPAQFAFGERRFAVGDAFTIEPGVYVSRKLLDILPDTPRNRAFIAKVGPVVARYEGIGVRIEDDYVITERGLERITRVPREIDEIEALMRTRTAASRSSHGADGRGGWSDDGSAR